VIAARRVWGNPADLAGAVDAGGKGAPGGQGKVEGGVSAAAKEEAMLAGGVLIGPDDLIRIIDAECLGSADKGQGIVEGVEDMDWHDTGSSLIVPLAESVDRKAELVSNARSA